MKGRFIVFEGIDGCGKTTQISKLTKWLPSSGLMPEGTILHITREPGGTELGKAFRELLLNPPKNIIPQDLTELLMYAADRAQHVSELILPNLEKGDWVVSDRFSGSTLSYQGYGREIDLNLINQLEKIATQGLNPNITFWLDLSVNESLARRKGFNNDRIEAEGSDFLQKVRCGFQTIAKQRNWIRVSAEQSKEIIAQNIKEELLKFDLEARRVNA